jgi:hypothetical protein
VAGLRWPEVRRLVDEVARKTGAPRAFRRRSARPYREQPSPRHRMLLDQ